MSTTQRARLTRYAWLSVGAAVVTIVLKTAAYRITGSVGLLSDAVESLVNLIGGIMALAMLTVAARPADKEHAYGHAKAEYFASGVEGTLILLAALCIAYAAVLRLINPQPLEEISLGLAISLLASLVNLVVALLLLRVGKRHRSITLESNAQHLLTDVWTSGGVVVGVGLVAATDWVHFDPIVAILVACNILWTGVRIVRHSINGLMDAALPLEEQETVHNVLATFPGVRFQGVRTRQVGPEKHVAVHVLVPGEWSVTQGRQFLRKVEDAIRQALPDAQVFTHLEALEEAGECKETQG